MMLNVDQRAVIVLKHMQGLSYPRSARSLISRRKTIKSRSSVRGRRSKDILKKKGVRGMTGAQLRELINRDVDVTFLPTSTGPHRGTPAQRVGQETPR